MTIRQPRVFLATPFSPERAGGEVPEVFARVQRSVEAACQLVGAQLDHPARVEEAGIILDQVLERLQDADAVIGIVTGNNPNVLFEVGHVARRAPILVVDNTQGLPFDLRIYRALEYGTPGAIETLTQRLANALAETLRAIAERVDPPIREWLGAIRRLSSAQGLFSGDEASSGPAVVGVSLRLPAQHVEGNGDASAVFEAGDLLKTSADENSGSHAILVGEHGSGKSTLLLTLAGTAWPAESNTRARSWLPLYVSVPAIVAATGVDISTRLRGALEKDGQVIVATSLPNDFVSEWSRRTRRPWIFLLDGLDEVLPHRVDAALSWLEEFMAYCTSHGHRIVLTTRPILDSDTRKVVPMNARKFTRTDVRTFYLSPLDDSQIGAIVRGILGKQARAFREKSRRSALRSRLSNPLLLKLAIAWFRKNGSFPKRRSELFDYFIDSMLDEARERGLREALGASVAFSLRPLVECLALSQDQQQAATTFLERKLQVPAVEAGGRARQILRDLGAGGGLLSDDGRGLTFTNPTVFEHLTACALKEQMATPVERSLLVEGWWDDALLQGVTRCFLSVLDDAVEVSRLLRSIHPGTFWRRWRRRDGHRELQALRFIAECLLDGCVVEPKFRARIERDLRRLSRDGDSAVLAAETLGALGDPKELLRLATEPRCAPETVAHALAALRTTDHSTQLVALATNDALPDRVRVMALLALDVEEAVDPAVELLEDHDAEDLVHIAAAMVVSKAENADSLIALLSEGHIDESSMAIVVNGCIERLDITPLWTASQDAESDPQTREANAKAGTVAFVGILQRLASDPSNERALRTAATSLLNDSVPPSDLRPLLTTKLLSAATRILVIATASERRLSALVDACAGNEVPLNVVAAVIAVLDEDKRRDGLAQIAEREDVAESGRLHAFDKLRARDPLRAFTLAASLPNDSELKKAVTTFTETTTSSMLSIAVQSSTEQDARFTAISVLVLANRTEAISAMLRSADNQVMKSLLVVVEQLERWHLLVEFASDHQAPDLVRMLCLGILGNHSKNEELQTVVDRNALSGTLSAFAQMQLRRSCNPESHESLGSSPQTRR